MKHIENILFSTGNLTDWHHVAEIIQEKTDVKISWLLTTEALNKTPESLKTGTVYQADYLKRGLCLNQDRRLDFQIDPKILKIYEDQAITLMSRMSLDNHFSRSQRRDLFYQLLNYWAQELKTKSISLIIFNISPHSIEELSLLFAARIFSTPTIIFQTTSVKELVYVITDFTMDDTATDYKYQFKTPPNESVSKETLIKHLEKMRGDANNVRPWFYNETPQNDSKLKLIFYSIINRLNSRNQLPFIHRLFPVYTKQKYNILTIAILKYYTLKNKKTNHFLKTYYRSKCAQNFCLNSKFIYVPLHFQPERTSLPEGCNHFDQVEIVQALAKIIDPDTIIAIKEHKTQFSSAYPFDPHRTQSFYDELLNVRNVVLIPDTQNSLEMIENALCVATNTGTAGWEALCRNVPVLVFGAAWYRDCPGAFYGSKPETYKNAISEISAGIKVNPREIEEFLFKLGEYGIRGYTTKSYSENNTFSRTENVKTLTKRILAIIDHLQSK